jgi:hypothetical protein
MGTIQSTHTTTEISSFEKEVQRSVSGRKQSNDDLVLVQPHVIMISTNDEDYDLLMTSDEKLDEDSDDDDDEEEGMSFVYFFCAVSGIRSFFYVLQFLSFPS